MTPLSSIAPKSSETSSATTQERSHAAQVDAARQFEAIFVRQMLSSLERTQGLGGQSQTGSEVYGSMMVNAVADMVTQGDGIGLSALVLEALSTRETPTTPQGGASAPQPAQANPESGHEALKSS